jgi:predicted  nucleic acid-binding Zn-ribbon protein
MPVEATVAEKLQMLWKLQQIDAQLDEIQILKGELPMEVSDLEDEVAGLDTRIKKLKAAYKESEQEIAKMQVTAKEADASIKKYMKQPLPKNYKCCGNYSKLTPNWTKFRF